MTFLPTLTGLFGIVRVPLSEILSPINVKHVSYKVNTNKINTIEKLKDV